MNESKTERLGPLYAAATLMGTALRRSGAGRGWLAAALLLVGPLSAPAAEPTSPPPAAPAPLAAPAPAAVQDIREEVARLNSQGIELYKGKQYAPAVDKLAAAYRLDPDPSILCNLARAQYKLAPGGQAVEYLEKCLATDTTLSETSRQTLEGYLKDARAHTVEIEPPPAPLLLVTPPVLPSARPARPLWRLVVGGGLAAAGAGLLVGGAYAWSIDGLCATPDPPCERIYKTTAGGISAVALGSAALIGGIVLLALPARRPASPSAQLRPQQRALAPGLASP